MQENTVYNKRNATEIYGGKHSIQQANATKICGGKHSIKQTERY